MGPKEEWANLIPPLLSSGWWAGGGVDGNGGPHYIIPLPYTNLLALFMKPC